MIPLLQLCTSWTKKNHPAVSHLNRRKSLPIFPFRVQAPFVTWRWNFRFFCSSNSLRNGCRLLTSRSVCLIPFMSSVLCIAALALMITFLEYLWVDYMMRYTQFYVQQTAQYFVLMLLRVSATQRNNPEGAPWRWLRLVAETCRSIKTKYYAAGNEVCMRQVQGNGTVVNLSNVVFIELLVKIEHPVDVYLQKSSYDLRKFKVKCP